MSRGGGVMERDYKTIKRKGKNLKKREELEKTKEKFRLISRVNIYIYKKSRIKSILVHKD